MNAYRRGACPALADPMPTGDGLLVRFAAKASIAPAALIGLCAAAREHGNGIMEITSRGSVQVRGLTEKSAPRFAAAIAELEVTESCAVPVICDPLPEHADCTIDSTGLGAQLRIAIGQAGYPLAPKVSVVLDGGSPLHLDAISADVRLRAFKSERGPLLHVSIGGDCVSAAPLGAVAPKGASKVVRSLLELIATSGPTMRASDILRRDGVAPFRFATAGQLDTAPALLPRPPMAPLGQYALRDEGIVLGIAPAFGQTDAESLAELASVAAHFGVHSLRPVPARGLLLLGVDRNRVVTLAAAAARHGFVVRPDDPRRSIIACPGKPACGSGWIGARALASELTHHLSSVHRGGLIHVSGCPKGCAHVGPAAWTIVGSERGCGIVRQGSAADPPHRYVNEHELVVEFARILQSREAAHA
jgi:precorrin-3B synthase